jgi:hypothetical protein
MEIFAARVKSSQPYSSPFSPSGAYHADFALAGMGGRVKTSVLDRAADEKLPATTIVPRTRGWAARRSCVLANNGWLQTGARG